MKTFRRFAIAVAVFGFTTGRAAAASPPLPNLVFILADDLGYGDLGSYGSPLRLTPAIDRLATEGARFTQFYAPTPYCAPARASLLTGRYPSRHGLFGNPTPDGTPAVDQLALAAGEILLPQLLRPRGYATGMIGKWHLGHKQVESWPTRRGFDSYYGILYSNDMRPVQLIEHEKVVEYPVVQATLTQRYTQRALDFITAHRERPFFLYLAHAMPHKPLAVSEKFAGKSGAGLYGDVLAELDWSVDQIMTTLRALGLDANTLVVFSSDNGAYFGGSSGGLRGMKAMTSEGGLRVPCIARWPGRIPAGQTLATPAGLIDWFPTLLARAGQPLPADRTTDGRDLWPVLTEKSAQLHEALFGFQGTTLRTVRSNRWKLHVEASQPRASLKPGELWIDPRAPDGVTILAPTGQAHPSQYPGLDTGDPLRAGALFDLETDPGEQHDVSAAHPEVVTRLRRLGEAHLQDASKSRPPSSPSIR
ncbi:sulfatase family protein [Horticoccus sp. 23ND18S-11]|uniref:sulfatase family protein n=1 Tax=Horticoccus sp. 23ND18S-11 TaxID=3391832 RepID=UPI0039C9DDCD